MWKHLSGNHSQGKVPRCNCTSNTYRLRIKTMKSRLYKKITQCLTKSMKKFNIKNCPSKSKYKNIRNQISAFQFPDPQAR